MSFADGPRSATRADWCWPSTNLPVVGDGIKNSARVGLQSRENGPTILSESANLFRLRPSGPKKMTQLTELFSSLKINEPAVWIALGSGLAVILIFLFLGRRQRRAVAFVAPAAENEVNPVDAWLPPSKRPDERRRSTRRSGVPTAVQVTDPKKPKKIIEGFVLDRSAGGVRLASEKSFPTGSTLHVRTSNAPPESPWVLITVRSCREVGDYFELGCQFQEDLPWHLLLMFG